MRLLITGGAGYIGSHTAQLLLRLGHQVVVYDNLSTGSREAVPGSAEFVLGDIRDGALLSRVLADRRIEAVIHFAAKLVVPESVERPWDYYETNTLGGVEVIKACLKARVPHLIFSSTAAVYGEAERPVQEGDPTAPVNPYGASKLMVEQLLKTASDSGEDLRWISLRYFNVAGAALDGSNGPRTKSSTLLIKVAAEVAAGKRPSLHIFGTDYETPDGTCVRDFIHVEDLAEAHWMALEALVAGRVVNEIYNCGYGRGSSVRQVAEIMRKVSGRHFEVSLRQRRAGDPPVIVANAGKIRSELDWVPSRDSLEVICDSTFKWELSQSQ